VFSEKGFIQVLMSAINSLKQGQLYESCIDIYEFLLEIYQCHRDYQNLGACFKDLKQICATIASSNKTQSRLFSNYYRVGFHGIKWKELNGVEFIYKEADVTRLSDLTERLKKQFGDKYGSSNLKLLPNTAIINQEISEDIYGLQLVYVEPYFDQQELDKRLTPWERKTHLSRFIYSTPYTVSGKRDAGPEQQCLRKTILTVETSFPNVRKRLRVIQKEEIDLTPIENAVEQINSRTQALRNELDTSPPNPKTLQINLQGAVLAQVNSGPAALARMFLSSKSDHPPEHVSRLEDACRDFVKTCGFAIVLNGKVIGPDQLDFQKECENGFAEIKREITSLISS